MPERAPGWPEEALGRPYLRGYGRSLEVLDYGPVGASQASAEVPDPKPGCAHRRPRSRESAPMLFMVIERFRSGRAPDVYRRFRDRGRMAPEGVRYVSSWVDLGFQRCFQVMEAKDEALLREWTRHWEDLVEFDIVPVLTSEEAAAAMAPNL